MKNFNVLDKMNETGLASGWMALLKRYVQVKF